MTSIKDSLTTQITFKIIGGTTYYAWNNENPWPVCQVQPRSGIITAPDTLVIQKLQPEFKNYSYVDFTAAAKSFADHLGSNHLGDGKSFTVSFYTVPVKIEIIFVPWKIATDIFGTPCSGFDGDNPGRYYTLDGNNKWVAISCAEAAIESGEPWILPPSNDILKGNSITSNLLFTDQQYADAQPIFKSESGLALLGTGYKFSVHMTKITAL